MRIILLVMLFLIWETWSPETAHWQSFPAHVGVPIFFSGYCLLILLTRIWGRRLANGIAVSDPGRAINWFNIGMEVCRVLIPVWFAIGVFVLGWKPAVGRAMGPLADFTPDTLVGLLPGFFAWMGLWWSHFPVDRALREHNVLFQLEADLPVFSPPTFRDYFINKLRVQLLFSIVPLLLILVMRDVTTLSAEALSHTALGQQWGLHSPLSDSVKSALTFPAVLLVLLLSPELLRHVLHTQRLPESRLRESLSEICKGAGVNCREILLWRTQNNLGNAAVMGLIPQVRYVMLSDLLLESMTDLQIQAVFAHELGHVKHRHLAWFVLFFLTVSSCLFALLAVLENHLKLTANGHEIFDLSSTFVCGAVLIVGYGFLSRWFERQADVYAARTLERAAVKDPLPPDMTGASIFASALERVAVVNNIPITARNWTHGSIAARMQFIHRLGRDPAAAARFDRVGRRVFVGLILLIAICAAVSLYGEIYR